MRSDIDGTEYDRQGANGDGDTVAGDGFGGGDGCGDEGNNSGNGWGDYSCPLTLRGDGPA